MEECDKCKYKRQLDEVMALMASEVKRLNTSPSHAIHKSVKAIQTKMIKIVEEEDG